MKTFEFSTKGLELAKRKQHKKQLYIALSVSILAYCIATGGMATVAFTPSIVEKIAFKIICVGI